MENILNIFLLRFIINTKKITGEFKMFTKTQKKCNNKSISNTKIKRYKWKQKTKRENKK